jgi:hypothetical protein
MFKLQKIVILFRYKNYSNSKIVQILKNVDFKKSSEISEQVNPKNKRKTRNQKQKKTKKTAEKSENSETSLMGRGPCTTRVSGRRIAPANARYIGFPPSLGACWKYLGPGEAYVQVASFRGLDCEMGWPCKWVGPSGFD